MKPAILGIDTSNYTTSLAVVSVQGEILLDSRKLLPVKEGDVGLRQTDALFLHVRQWPEILLQSELHRWQIIAVTVATRPCPLPGSYMPVFLAGQAFAATIAGVLQVPLMEFSHQEGHMRAALEKGAMMRKPFVAVQISGGTTDVLHATPKTEGGFDIVVLAKSCDWHAGQFIDRVGIHMGLSFPCGVAMDKLAEDYALAGGEPLPIPSSVQAGSISFSGPASHAMRALDRGTDKGAVALGVFRCISNSLEKVLRERGESEEKVILCGGVAANTHIRERLMARLRRYEFLLAPRHLAGDNAVGIAFLGLDSMLQKGDLC